MTVTIKETVQMFLPSMPAQFTLDMLHNALTEAGHTFTRAQVGTAVRNIYYVNTPGQGHYTVKGRRTK